MREVAASWRPALTVTRMHARTRWCSLSQGCIEAGFEIMEEEVEEHKQNIDFVGITLI
jgi:hypothetical protein